jgi:hypothetical protein
MLIISKAITITMDLPVALNTLEGTKNDEPRNIT